MNLEFNVFIASISILSFLILLRMSIKPWSFCLKTLLRLMVMKSEDLSASDEKKNSLS